MTRNGSPFGSPTPWRSLPRAALGTFLAVLLATAMLVPGRGASAVPGPDRGHLPSVRIEARDNAYIVSRPRLRPGPIDVTFANHGPHVHALQTARLDPGRTQAEFVEVLVGFLDGTVTEAPPWLHQDVPFGFGPTSPRRWVTASVVVSQPGRYVLFDLLVDGSGRTFAEQGMVGSFLVEGDPSVGALPQAEAIITATDAAFLVPPLHAGHLVLRLTNQATVERQFAVVALRRGRTLDGLRTWLRGGQVGPPPGEFVANVLPIASGADLLLTLRLAAGCYLLVDNGESPEGVPYSDLGLLTGFVVGPPASGAHAPGHTTSEGQPSA